jgi:AP2 domain.
MVAQFKWNANVHPSGVYARRTSYVNGNKVEVKMHRLVTNAPEDKQVDHKNGNKLDNRKENLRLCTNTENQQNRQSVRGSSKFKGVDWNKRAGKWRARVEDGDKSIFLGHFIEETDAAEAYNKAATELFGEFAYLNETGRK